MTNAIIKMSGVFAELELRIIRERVRSGMANAEAKGAKIGRPQTTADEFTVHFSGVIQRSRQDGLIFECACQSVRPEPHDNL